MVAVLAFGAEMLLDADGTVTFSGGQLLRGLQPGPVLLSQGLPFPGRVITGLPDLVAGIGFGLAGAGQFSVGGMNQRRSALTGLVAFRPCRLSDPGGLRYLLLSMSLGGLGLGVSAGNRLGQFPPRVLSHLTSAAGPGLGDLPATMRGCRRFQHRKNLLLSLRGTRLGGNRPRLGTTPGRLRLRQLHSHRFGIQRRGLAAGQHDQGTGLPDQRLQRAERVTGLLR